MKWSKYLLTMLVCILAVTGFSVAEAQEDVEEPEETLQVVLVLDVSKSMHEPVLYGDLPEELLTVIDQLNAIARCSLKFKHKKQNLVSLPTWKKKSKLVRLK